MSRSTQLNINFQMLIKSINSGSSCLPFIENLIKSWPWEYLGIDRINRKTTVFLTITDTHVCHPSVAILFYCYQSRRGSLLKPEGCGNFYFLAEEKTFANGGVVSNCCRCFREAHTFNCPGKGISWHVRSLIRLFNGHSMCSKESNCSVSVKLRL